MKTKYLVIVGIVNLKSENQLRIAEVNNACTALEAKYGKRQQVVQCHQEVINVSFLGTSAESADISSISDFIEEDTKIELNKMNGQEDIGMYIYANNYDGALAHVLDPPNLAKFISSMGFNDKTRPIRKMCLISCRTFENMKHKKDGFLFKFHSCLGDNDIHTTLAGYSRPVFVATDGSKLASPLTKINDPVFQGRTPVTGTDDKYALSEKRDSKTLREAIKIVWTWNKDTQIATKFPDSTYHDENFG